MPNFRIATRKEVYVVENAPGGAHTIVDAPNNDGGGTAPPEAALLNPLTENLDAAGFSLTDVDEVSGAAGADIDIAASVGNAARVRVNGTSALVCTENELCLLAGGAPQLEVRASGVVSHTSVSAGANAVTSSHVPSAASDLCNKAYVDLLEAGLKWKFGCRAGTTANVDLLTGGLLTVDGVVLVAADRVLVIEQADPVDNGIYAAAVGAWVRTTDFDGTPANEVQGGSTTLITEGTTLAGTQWTVSGTGNVNVGVDPIVFIETGLGVGPHTHDGTDIVSGMVSRANLPVGTTGVDVAAGEHLHNGQTITPAAVTMSNPAALQTSTDTLNHYQYASGTLTNTDFIAFAVNPVAYRVQRVGNLVAVNMAVGSTTGGPADGRNVTLSSLPVWARPTQLTTGTPFSYRTDNKLEKGVVYISAAGVVTLKPRKDEEWKNGDPVVIGAETVADPQVPLRWTFTFML